METEKLVVNTVDGKAEVTILRGDAPKQLEIKAPRVEPISGTIGTVVEWLTKRLDQPDQINQKRCMVVVSRENNKIVLTVNENDEYLYNTIIGRIELHPKFKEFGINTEKAYEPALLGQFFKMNRYYFADQSENMSLVSILKNFEAKIDSTIEKQKLEAGSFKDNYSAVVTSNLPGTFKLKMPLFKGSLAEVIEVEFFAKVNGRDVSLQLFSPGAVQALDEIRDQLIDAEIEKIKSIAPDIAIIEQ